MDVKELRSLPESTVKLEKTYKLVKVYNTAETEKEFKKKR
jgi:hypothetical protein